MISAEVTMAMMKSVTPIVIVSCTNATVEGEACLSADTLQRVVRLFISSKQSDHPDRRDGETDYGRGIQKEVEQKAVAEGVY